MPYTQFINHTIETNDNSIVDWFGRLELGGKKQQVIAGLQLIDPSILDVSIISQNGLIHLYCSTSCTIRRIASSLHAVKSSAYTQSPPPTCSCLHR